MTDKELELRLATAEDAGPVRDLVRSAMRHYREESGIVNDTLESLSESVESVRHRIEKNKCLCLFDGDRPLGTITMSLCTTPMKYSFSKKSSNFLAHYTSCGYISRFAVADEVRKTGLGSRLMDEVLTFPEAENVVILHTAVSNKSMCEFYASKGFVLVDSENSRGYERGLFALIKSHRE